jgi:hypothetical protein
MTDRLSIEHQNEIILDCLLAAAGYDFSRDEKKAVAEDEKSEMSPVDCLRMVNAKVDQETTT